MKTKIIWTFTIVFTMVAICFYIYYYRIQKNLSNTQFSQDNIQDDTENKEFIPYISMAAVKEGSTICYRDGSNLMCKNGTKSPVLIAENIEGQFMLFQQTVYYFTHNLDLHKMDIHSQEDILMIPHTNASFIGAYKNSIYLCSSNHTSILMVTEHKSTELYTIENTPLIHFTTILKGQLFIVADAPDKKESKFHVSENNQIIYKINLSNLNKEETSLEYITTCKLPRQFYTEYVQNVILADENAMYCLNIIDHWKYSSLVKEVEIIRIDETGMVESLMKKKRTYRTFFHH